MLSAPPTQREYNANGELLLGTNSGDGNPLYNIDKFQRDNNTDKFIMAQSFNLNLAKGLSLRLNANWMYDEGFYESFNKDYLSRPGTMNTSRNSSASFIRTLSQTYNSVLSYNLDFAEFHTIDALAGFEFYDSYYKGFSAAGSGAPTDDFADLGLTSLKEGLRDIDSQHVRERIMSFFGRANYDYKDKYLVSAVFRQDGYSKLLGDNRWGFFPGVSGGWVISKEDFMMDNNIFSFMKLRTSYGLNGNVSGIGAYTLQGSYNSTLYNNQVGYLIGSIPNPTLRWERSQTFEVGADFGFLQNIINANFTYYNRLTLDKYASIPLPETSGISSITSNNGELRNSGIEADLSFKVLRKNDLKWDIGANFTFNKNTIVKLPDNGLEKNRQGAFQVYDPNSKELIWVGGYQEGQSPGDLYVFIAEGIFKDAAQVAEIAGNRKDITSGNNGSNGKPLYGPNLWNQLSDADKAKGFPIQPGDVIWKDINGDNIIDNYDLEKVGNVTPKFFGGLNTTLTYKGLKLYARMDYSLGYKQLDSQAPWFLGMMQGSFNTLEDSKQTWTPENTSAPYPIYTWADQLGKRNYARNNSMFVYNANYLAFREVSLIYSLPRNWMEITGIGGIDISVTGQNLGYLTASKLYTPENSSTSGTGGGYALPRTIIFGVDIRF
jgi:TonB-linked SusC/RagA family outer membrane protein